MSNVKSSPAPEIDFVQYIKIIYRRRVIVGIVVALSMVVAGVLNYLKPATYEASATFFSMNIRENYVAASGGGAPQIKRQMMDIEDLLISILGSRKMAERIADQVNAQNPGGQVLTGDVWRMLRVVTKISPGRNGIISLSVQTASPELSAQIANAYVDNLDYFNNQFEIGSQKKIVQVIDRAVVPTERMPRNISRKIVCAGFSAFIFSAFACFLLEFFQKSDLLKRIREDS